MHITVYRDIDILAAVLYNHKKCGITGISACKIFEGVNRVFELHFLCVRGGAGLP